MVATSKWGYFVKLSADIDHMVCGAPGHPDKVLLSRVGLHMPMSLGYTDWERAGNQLAAMIDSSAWCLGDWLVYGKANFSDRYKRAIRSAGLKYQTLRNYAWVARRFSLERRRSALTFQHHAEVASLPPAEQERWLNEAERGDWSTKQLRGRLRDVTIAGSAPNPTSVIPRIAVNDTRLLRWREAADQTGAGFDNWVVEALDRAAESALDDDAVAVPR